MFGPNFKFNFKSLAGRASAANFLVKDLAGKHLPLRA
jgi:hypothetical protein